VNIIGFSHPQVNEVFTKGDVLAVEYFISNGPEMSKTDEDGWSLIGNKEGFVAQQEHTILITEGKPVILTLENGI
jgi:methionyl aminopeptidase